MRKSEGKILKLKTKKNYTDSAPAFGSIMIRLFYISIFMLGSNAVDISMAV